MREIAPIFATAAGSLAGYLVSPDGMGLYVGAILGLTTEVIVSHLPPFIDSTLHSEP